MDGNNDYEFLKQYFITLGLSKDQLEAQMDAYEAFRKQQQTGWFSWFENIKWCFSNRS